MIEVESREVVKALESAPTKSRSIKMPAVIAVAAVGACVVAVAVVLMYPRSPAPEPVEVANTQQPPVVRPTRAQGETVARSFVQPYAEAHGTPEFLDEGLATTTTENGTLIVNGLVVCGSKRHAYTVLLKEGANEWEPLGILFDGQRMFVNPVVAKALAQIEQDEKRKSATEEAIEISPSKPEGRKLVLLARRKVAKHVPYKSYSFSGGETVVQRGDGLVVCSGVMAIDLVEQSARGTPHVFKSYTIVFTPNGDVSDAEVASVQIDGRQFGP
jgi:hypothetical protein